jgi:hypothetical protein
MQIKTSELTDPALDWAVAKCKEYRVFKDAVLAGSIKRGWWFSGLSIDPNMWAPLANFSPSTNWAQGGPIIERGLLVLYPDPSDGWRARSYMDLTYYKGSTPLIAAMRAYVASQLGDEVDVPEELL